MSLFQKIKAKLTSKDERTQEKSKWIPILPPKQNDYQGQTAAIVFLVIMGCILVFRSLMHTFETHGGAVIIAGYTIEQVNDPMIIWAWAWSGVFQIIEVMVLWMILIRYRKFIPLVYIMLLMENLLLKLVGVIKPTTPPAGGVPPGAIFYLIMLPLMIVFFFLSLRKSSKYIVA